MLSNKLHTLFAKAWTIVIVLVLVAMSNLSVNVVSASDGNDYVEGTCGPFSPGAHWVWNGWNSHWECPNTTTTTIAPTPQPVPTPVSAQPVQAPVNSGTGTVTTYPTTSTQPQTQVFGEVLGGSCSQAFAYSQDHSLVCSQQCGMVWRSATAYGCPAGSAVQPTASTAPQPVPAAPTATTQAPQTPQPFTYYNPQTQKSYRVEYTAPVFSAVAFYPIGQSVYGSTSVATVTEISTGTIIGYLWPVAIGGYAVYLIASMPNTVIVPPELVGVTNSASANAIPTANVQAIDIPGPTTGNVNPTPPGNDQACETARWAFRSMRALINASPAGSYWSGWMLYDNVMKIPYNAQLYNTAMDDGVTGANDMAEKMNMCKDPSKFSLTFNTNGDLIVTFWDW